VDYGTLTIVGDLNVQLGEPSDEAESEVAEALTAAWQHVGSLAIESGSRTRRGARGNSTIDHVIVPHSWCSRCSVGRVWTNESDHAWLDAHVGNVEGSTGRACTSNALHGLPSDAFVDLRLRFRTLGRLFGIRDSSGVAGPIDLSFPIHEELPRGHPALEVVVDMPADEGVCDGGDGRDVGRGAEHSAPNLILRRWGGQFMRAMLLGWWTTWRGRRERGDPIAELLKRAQTASGGFTPSGRVADWMAGYQHEVMHVPHNELQRWIQLRAHERLLQRRERLPFCRERLAVRRDAPDQRSQVGRQMLRAGAGNTRYYTCGGQELTRFSDAEACMWMSRKDIWDSLPNLPGGADAVLDSYFDGRTAHFPGCHSLTDDTIRGVVLASRDSAPVGDGIPYEIYH